VAIEAEEAGDQFVCLWGISYSEFALHPLFKSKRGLLFFLERLSG